MSKPIKTIVKLIVSAGAATPAPPIGPSLAAHGIAIAEFCAKFNEATKDRKGEPTPVEVTIYEDRSFDFVLKKPPVSALLKRYAKIEKGSKDQNREFVATLTQEEIRKITEEKLSDLNTDNIEAAVKIVAGTARSMGIKISDS